MTTHTWTSRPIRRHAAATTAAALVALLAPVAVVSSAIPAAAADKPGAGRFVGAHDLGGPVRLTFARESGIGLHLSRYSVAGTLRCEGEPDIPFDYDRMQVTAKTAARVSGKTRRFAYRAATLEITGRFVSATRVVGTVTAKASYCMQSAGFVARLS